MSSPVTLTEASACRGRLAAARTRVVLGPLEQEVGVVGPGEAHAPVELDVVAGHLDRGLGRVGGGHGGGPDTVGLVAVRRPGRVVDAHPGQLERVEHVHDPVLHDLEAGDRLVEDHPDLGVLGGHLEGPVGHPDRLGGQRHRDVVEDAPPQRRPGSPARAERLGGRAVEHQAGQLAGRVEGRDQLGLRLPDEEGPHPVLAQGRHDHPVGRVPVDHGRLDPVQDPARALAGRPGPHRVQRVPVALLQHGDRPPGRPGGQLVDQALAPPAPGPPGWPPPPTRRTAPGAAPAPSARGRCTSPAGRRPRRGPASTSTRGTPAGPTTRACTRCRRRPAPAGARPSTSSMARRATSCRANCSASNVKSTVHLGIGTAR